ncbi:MAG: hypothetical protein ACREMY_23020 [bacterium]
MPTCLSSASKTTAASDARYVRVLKWTFRRGGETMTCELGLTSDNSAYELRIDPPANPAGSTTELFDDAMTAFQRHARIERILVQEGWSLDTFESQRLPRH